MTAACESCAQLVEQNDHLQKRAVDDHDRIDALVNTVTEKDHKISALKGELTKLRTDSPRMKDAEEVFRFWQTRLHKNARTNFGPKRQEKVLARLKEKSSHADIDRKQDLKWAVRGCEALPWSANFQRYAEPGPGRKKKDDLAIVCFDETSIERFSGYADERADAAFRSFCRALSRHGPVDVSEDRRGPFHVISGCPLHNGIGGLVATPGTAASGDLLWIECRSGCTADAVKERLRGSAGLKVAV